MQKKRKTIDVDQPLFDDVQEIADREYMGNWTMAAHVMLKIAVSAIKSSCIKKESDT